MDFEQAIAIILYLQHRPQTDMTDQLRRMQKRAWQLVCIRARMGIEAEEKYLKLIGGLAPVSNGERGGDI